MSEAPHQTKHFDSLIRELAGHRAALKAEQKAGFYRDYARLAEWAAEHGMMKASAVDARDALAAEARGHLKTIAALCSAGKISDQQRQRLERLCDAIKLRENLKITLRQSGVDVSKALSPVYNWAADAALRKAIMPEDREADARIIETGRQAMQRKKSHKAGLSDWSSIEPAERRAA